MTANIQRILEGYKEFGPRPEGKTDDLPGLKEYLKGISIAVCGDICDARQRLDSIDAAVSGPDEFEEAKAIGYSIQNAADRIVELADIGSAVSSRISELEAKGMVST